MWLSSATFYTRKAKGDFWNIGGGGHGPFGTPLNPPMSAPQDEPASLLITFFLDLILAAIFVACCQNVGDLSRETPR